MAGLKDLLLLRELQDQSDPFRSAFQSLAQGVDIGIQEAQVEAKRKRKLQEEKDLFFQSAGGSSDNTNSNIIRTISFDSKTGLKRTLKTKTKQQRLTEEKTQLEVKELKNRLAIPSVFDDISKAASEVIESDLDIGGISTIIPRTRTTVTPRTAPEDVPGRILIPQFDASGRPKGAVDIGATSAIKRAEAEVAVSSQVSSQREKAADLAERDFRRASAAADTSFDEVLNFADEQFKKFGVSPGDFLGLFDKWTPSQFNRYKDAATGAGKEAAALIARQIIPGVRAANITVIFAKSAAQVGATIEANARNVAASMGNAIANALSQNVKVINDATGKEEGILSFTIDPVTGKTLSEIGIIEQSRAINDIKRDFANTLESDYILRVFKKNPRLLRPATIRSRFGRVE